MLKVGIIGAGSVSGTYLYTLGRNPLVSVEAIADPVVGKAEKSAVSFGIPRVYSSHKDMLAKEKLEAVFVCSPHYLHHDQVLDCAERGIHILCEKPLATNMPDIVDMVEKCDKIKFGVMLQRRFFPNSLATREAIKKGLLGRIKSVSLKFTCHKSPDFYNTWRGKKISGGGVIISQALHRIDLLNYFFGSPRAVEGETRITRPEIEVEDYAKGKIYFDGIIAEVEANNSSGNPETISVTRIEGEKGVIELSDDKTPVWGVKEMPAPVDADISAVPEPYRPAYYGPCHERVIDDFVSAVVSGHELFIPGEAAVDSMKIVFGFYASAREMKKIVLDKI